MARAGKALRRSSGPSKESPKCQSGRDPKPQNNVREHGIQQITTLTHLIANDLSTATQRQSPQIPEAALSHLDKKIADLS